MKPEERDGRTDGGCGPKRNREIQSNSNRLDSQPKANSRNSITRAECDYEKKCVAQFRCLIYRQQVWNRGEGNCPGKNEHCENRPQRPHIFPPPTIHEASWGGETSVEYAGPEG